MFTIIGIVLIGLALITTYLVKAIAFVKKATYAVIDEWGLKPIDLLDPGLHIIAWPWHTLHEVISTEVHTDNLKSFVVTCAVENGLAHDSRAPNRPYGIADLATSDKNVSFNFRIQFCKKSDGQKRKNQLNVYYRLVKETPDGKADQSALLELLHDIIQELFREKTIGVNIYEARNPVASKIDEIKTELATRCAGLDLPIDILQLAVNQPFEPKDAVVREALMKRSAVQLKIEDDLVAKKGETQVAKEAVKLAKETAEAEKVKIELEAQARKTAIELEAQARKAAIELEAVARGFDKLTPEQKAEALLKLRALEVYAQVASGPSAKIIIGGTDFMKEVSAIVGALTKGGKA